MQTFSYHITYVVICFWSLSLSSVVVAGSGAGGRASIGGIKGACPAPLIVPQSALVDWGAGFPAATYANQLSLVLRTRGRELP